MLRSERLVYLATSVLNAAVRVSGSSRFSAFRSVSLARSAFGDVRLLGHIYFHGRIFHQAPFSFFGAVLFLNKNGFSLSGCLSSVSVSEDCNFSVIAKVFVVGKIWSRWLGHFYQSERLVFGECA
jgi:hypothetical protein